MRILVVDAFTPATPFRGNPAAVVLVDDDRDDTWMLRVAAEMRHSETAFVRPRGDGSFDLRWFTPTVEMDLCGHATLAAAHALVEWGLADPPILFHTRSGELRAARAEPGFELDFPVTAPEPWDVPTALFDALRVAPAPGAKGGQFGLVELGDAAAVRALAPDQAGLAAVEVDAVIATARGDGDHDVVLRVFAPRLGIPEDPVTGAAQCLIGPYWAPRLGSELLVEQASPRGGVLRVHVDGERVRIGGDAVTVLDGDLRV